MYSPPLPLPYIVFLRTLTRETLPHWQSRYKYLRERSQFNEVRKKKRGRSKKSSLRRFWRQRLAYGFSKTKPHALFAQNERARCRSRSLSLFTWPIDKDPADRGRTSSAMRDQIDLRSCNAALFASFQGDSRILPKFSSSADDVKSLAFARRSGESWNGRRTMTFLRLLPYLLREPPFPFGNECIRKSRIKESLRTGWDWSRSLIASVLSLFTFFSGGEKLALFSDWFATIRSVQDRC